MIEKLRMRFRLSVSVDRPLLLDSQERGRLQKKQPMVKEEEKDFLAILSL